jgi:hypothetical protein
MLVALEIDPGNTGVPKPELISARLKELREKGVKWIYLGSSSFLNVNGALFTRAAVENGIAIVEALLSAAADGRRPRRGNRRAIPPARRSRP